MVIMKPKSFSPFPPFPPGRRPSDLHLLPNTASQLACVSLIPFSSHPFLSVIFCCRSPHLPFRVPVSPDIPSHNPSAVVSPLSLLIPLSLSSPLPGPLAQKASPSLPSLPLAPLAQSRCPMISPSPRSSSPLLSVSLPVSLPLLPES